MKPRKVIPPARFEQIALHKIRGLIEPNGHSSGKEQSAAAKPAHIRNGTAKKTRRRKPRIVKVDLSKDLWISPNLSMRGRHGDRAWDRSGNLPPGAGTRLLELADVALGLKKHATQNKVADAQPHETVKNEPYSV
jgi:hypothetical protein